MAEQGSPSLSLNGAERPVAAASVAAAFAAFFSAAACCVIPAALAIAGLGAGGFAFVVPYHWPLTLASGVAVAFGWMIYLRKRRACKGDANCAVEAPSQATLWLLSAATLFVLLSVAWKAFFEAPLQAWLLTL
jgi:mercuric ion transport protein